MGDKDQIEQMPLFSLGEPPSKAEPQPPKPPTQPLEAREKGAPQPRKETKPEPRKEAQPATKQPRPGRKPAAKQLPPPPPSRSGLVPEGDVRLTANIREDLHLKLKIAAAKRRTTIGEIIEELVETYI